ncbi:MAG: CapA family protein [Leptospiraceae bacterium]|nr:CapA family protein [Leptospiraceae bacterium]MDW7977149.1 CapA family protein [Leptospiraceae bacterium]
MKKKSFIFINVLLSISLLAQERVSFAVVGDIMNHQLQIDTSYRAQCDCWDYKPSFEKIKPYLESADITIGNLETTLPGKRELFSGYPEFGAPDELLDALRWSGFDILTLANNHTIDKKALGVVRTKKRVLEEGLIPLGTYFDFEDFEKNSVFLYEKNQIRFAFLNFTYGTNGKVVPYPHLVDEIEFEALRKRIAQAKKHRPDVVILLLHYGTEYQTEPDVYQRAVVRLALLEGVDIILGGHPHVLQPFEILRMRDKYGVEKERLIVWSLGNFISNQKRINTDGGMVFEFQVVKKNQEIFIQNVDYLPVYVDFYQWHVVLPITEHIFLSKELNPHRRPIYPMDWKNEKYYIYFKNPHVHNKDKMVLFFKNAVKILKTLPKRLEIRTS